MAATLSVRFAGKSFKRISADRISGPSTNSPWPDFLRCFCSAELASRSARCFWRARNVCPMADMFGLYFLERLFDTAATAVIAGLGLVLFESRSDAGRHQERSAKRSAEGGSHHRLIPFSRCTGAIVVLVYLRLHGTAMLERRWKVGPRRRAGRPPLPPSFWVLRAAYRPFALGANWRSR